MPDELTSEPHEDQSNSADPLSMPQRMIAGLSGAAALGAGGVSVFMTSNQAGSVALLGVGALFLTVAVNGSPLLGAKFKDFELAMAPRRRKVAEQARHDDPEEGQRKLDVLEQLDPAARDDPAVINAYATLYRKEVEAALARAVARDSDIEVVNVGVISPGRTDLQVQAPELNVDVELLYSSSQRSVGLNSIQFSILDARRSHVRRILVTNMRTPDAVLEYVEMEMKARGTVSPVQVVRWLDHQDDKALALALHRLGIKTSTAPE